ncbi:putative enzyme related to lactoylglutathione lyase [Nocardioides albertanoniae]|uniref:Putative enzyme related to lactoylglutathione lyase n=1 Tax=Nocardioides albertanoniae TaxID=1175486 RepID=A0A543ADX3_9ACTN|nr:VOC family protein [Nocardioides albertanoniae]TQL70782.1 putative enzyme related to lactoylglutathione lyase [Nocardioides albertanoniae]
MAIARNPQFAIDCPDVTALSAFYAELLGWEVKVDNDDPDDAWADIRGEGGSIAFQQVSDFKAPTWPSQDTPQQIHLDVDVDDLDEGEKQVLALGATKADHQPGTTFRVFLDPAGHPFCLCQA